MKSRRRCGIAPRSKACRCRTWRDEPSANTSGWRITGTGCAPPPRESPESTLTPSADLANDHDVEYLDLDDVIGLASALLGDPPPIRDLGLLASAVARPQATVFGEDAYPDVLTKAAALLHSLVKNHPLIDGNKRLGWMACAVFLEVNGLPASGATNDDVYDFVMEVAAGNLEVSEIARRLRAIIDG